jgi:hypothetical protein
MRNNLIILSAILVIAACKPSNQQQEMVPVTVEQLVDQPDGFAGKLVNVSGTVSHVCRHGGQKLFLFGADSEKLIQVNTGSSATEFDVALEGTEVEVTGVLNELRIDEAYIAALEKENSKADSASTEEVTDSLSIHQHEQQMQNTAYLRKQVAESGKGYISEFWIEATAYASKKTE